jgi:MFS family permease
VTITLSLMLAVYAIVNGNIAGWLSTQTLSLLAISAALFGVFLWIERTVSVPLVPFSIFRLKNVGTASVIGIMWSAAMFSWFFLSALYLQIVLGYTPLQVGLSFLPANLIMAAFSVGLSAWVVMRYGVRWPLAIGMGIVALGLGLSSLAPLSGTFLLHVLPPMLLLGFGAGLAFNPVLLSATSDVPPQESGLASGVLNTAFMMGGSLGLAILASLAAYQTTSALAGGADQPTALLSGYHVAFAVGAIFALGAAVLAAARLQEIANPSAATH